MCCSDKYISLTLIVFQFHISKYIHGTLSELNCSLTFHTLPEDIINFEYFRLDTACVYLVVGYVNDYKVSKRGGGCVANILL